jgi:aspartyl-tRNA(Asn)/glutamyl-tRNA(Gln) amidotransferase subunit B
VARRANEAGHDLDGAAITPSEVARVQALVDAGALTDTMARSVIEAVLAGEGDPDAVVTARGLGVVSDGAALQEAVDRAITALPDAAAKVRAGKTAAVGALIGAVMKDLGGQADAGAVRVLLLERLGAS